MKAPENGDDDLDAFMQGRDALSQRLKALTQPEPPEALSAAIQARVERDLLEEKKLPPAANDSIVGDARATAAAARPRSRRIFASMALAAGLLLVAGVSMQWRKDSVPAPAVLAQSTAPVAAETPAAVTASVSPSPSAERAPQPPAPPKMLAQADIAPSPSSTVVRSGPPAAPAPPEAVGDDKANQWLALIDGLLSNGMRRDALEEWREFRRTYPDYPVAQALKARIDEAGRAAAATSDGK